MALLEFINENVNWKDILQKEPYNLSVKQDSYGHVMVKYKKDNFDFDNPIIQESRGCIVAFIDGKWKYVCRPFDKFGNYGESYAATLAINWDKSFVREKIDGSLVKFWYSEICNKWMVSTNGTIDAKEATLPACDIDYYTYFCDAIGKDNLSILIASMDKKYTYMFELVGPENKIIIDYEKAVYFLAARHNETGVLYMVYGSIVNKITNHTFIKIPKIYYLHSLSECITIAASFGKDKEGFVVSDIYGNMIKVKSPEYLIAARINNNRILTIKNAIEIIKENRLDDFNAYASIELIDKMDDIIKAINSIASILDFHTKNYIFSFNRKDVYFSFVDKADELSLSKSVKSLFISYAMCRYDGKVSDAKDFLLNHVPISKLEDAIESYLI